MGRFDPREGENYGKCVTCGVALATVDDAKAHRMETMKPGGTSHSTQGMNPDRESRIQRHVDGVVEDAISDAIDDLQRVIYSGDVTEEEIVAALNWHSDFADAWKSES